MQRARHPSQANAVLYILVPEKVSESDYLKLEIKFVLVDLASCFFLVTEGSEILQLCEKSSKQKAICQEVSSHMGDLLLTKTIIF